ncbi:MAG: hypothetical protein SVR94_02140, partial [Pseudomonadota bacterium]|nr:hypothetical protein [Pseudomonadota bacterium]
MKRSVHILKGVPRLFVMLLMGMPLSLVQAATDCNQVTEIPVAECEALLDLYHQTNGSNWNRNSGWNETNTPCSWGGVTCGGGYVTELSLSYNRLSGLIPGSIGQLRQLTLLNFRKNQLSGPIPESLGQLSQLKELNLGSNQLSGPIPESLGQLSQLTVLRLNENQLSGPIPESLGQLSQLTVLRLNENQLSGPIPESLGQLSQL